VTEVEELERAFRVAWPALETVQLDCWALRASGAVTRRGNSALAPPVDGPLGPRVEAVERFYRERRLPVLFQLSPTSDPRLDGELAERGYAREAETIVMVGPLGGIDGDGAGVEVAAAPSAPWLAHLDRADGFGPRLRYAQDILAAIAVPAAYALATEAGEPVAQARAAVDGELLGIYQVSTVPAARRRGLARACMAALARWGEAHGATRGYVLVERDNAPARALYGRLGFEERFRYWYRLAG
jgi:ribosomal protein S18 acetylase RimI-like enzyme